MDPRDKPEDDIGAIVRLFAALGRDIQPNIKIPDVICAWVPTFAGMTAMEKREHDR